MRVLIAAAVIVGLGLALRAWNMPGGRIPEPPRVAAERSDPVSGSRVPPPVGGPATQALQAAPPLPAADTGPDEVPDFVKQIRSKLSALPAAPPPNGLADQRLISQELPSPKELSSGLRRKKALRDEAAPENSE